MKMMSQSTKQPSLKNLKYLSLVLEVYTELESHLEFRHIVLAESITEICRKCEMVDEANGKLKENGVDMPNYFDHSLLKIIHAILPPKMKSKYDTKTNKMDDNGLKSSSCFEYWDTKDMVRDWNGRLRWKRERGGNKTVVKRRR